MMAMIDYLHESGAIVPRCDWINHRHRHRDRVGPAVIDHRERAARGQKHPVRDFLFTYYSFRPAHLLRYSPGFDVALANGAASDCDWPAEQVIDSEGIVVPASRFPSHRIDYLHWAINYLNVLLDREPAHHCMGLHEWAMVYETETVRHPQIQLRLSRDEIADVVREQGLRCTHYEAYRFFTPAAMPLNRVSLSRSDAVEHDQPGCIHATMDLYKFAYAIAPWMPSDLIADAFELAGAARSIDMRASPYDLRSIGYEPIRIETRDGRDDYVAEQKRLSQQARPLRAAILHVYMSLLSTISP
jgi:hypothetical protein